MDNDGNFGLGCGMAILGLFALLAMGAMFSYSPDTGASYGGSGFCCNSLIIPLALVALAVWGKR